MFLSFFICPFLGGIENLLPMELAHAHLEREASESHSRGSFMSKETSNEKTNPSDSVRRRGLQEVQLQQPRRHYLHMRCGSNCTHWSGRS